MVCAPFAERRMAGDVVDPLGADIDGAAVAHALELFFSADQHCRSVGLRTWYNRCPVA